MIYIATEDKIVMFVNENKCKIDPLQAWTGPECSRKLRFSDFVKTAHDGGR